VREFSGKRRGGAWVMCADAAAWWAMAYRLAWEEGGDGERDEDEEEDAAVTI